MNRIRRLTPLALVAVALAAPALAAQDVGSTWVLDESRGGFCVWYLTDPEIAPLVMPKGAVPRVASATSQLPAMLERIVRDEPRFAAWIPSVLCIGQYGAAQADGRQLDRARENRPVVVTWLAMAAEAPFGVTHAEWLLSDVGGSAPQLERVAGQSTLLFSDRPLRNNRAEGDEEDNWELRIDGMKLFWTGRQVGEVRVGSTRTMSFGYTGTRTTTWEVEVDMAPGSERSLIGSLRIEGKQPLANALKASPVRAVGAAELGGRTTFTFRRAGR